MINEYENTGNIYANNETLSNDEVISTLNGLIETCKDGQEGFKHAAEGITDSQIKSAFYQYGQQRAQFAGELQSLVRQLGGDPETSTSILGTLHRGWIDIKSAVTGQDDAAILNEAERGEDVAKNAYQEALKQNLPHNVRTIIDEQFSAVKEAHDRVKMMRNAENAKSQSANTNH